MTNPTPSASALEAAARLQGYTWRESWDSPGTHDVEASDGAEYVKRSDVAAALDAFAREAVERCAKVCVKRAQQHGSEADAEEECIEEGSALSECLREQAGRFDLYAAEAYACADAIRSAFHAQESPHESA